MISIVLLLCGSCFSGPEVAPCNEPRLWYSPVDDSEILWACEGPPGWLPSPPDVVDVGPRLGLGPFPVADTGVIRTPVEVPPLDTGERLPPLDTGLLADTGDGGLAPRDTSSMEADTADTFFSEDTGPLPTGLTADTFGLEDTLTTADTGGFLLQDTFGTADTGLP